MTDVWQICGKYIQNWKNMIKYLRNGGNLMDNNELIVDNLSKEITELVIKSREKLKDEMNNEQIKCYWDIGRKIIEEEQKGKIKK